MDTPILLSPDLTEKVSQQAALRGMTVNEFVRVTLERLVSADMSTDSLYCDTATWSDDGPADAAENHDKYLYGDES